MSREAAALVRERAMNVIASRSGHGMRPHPELVEALLDGLDSAAKGLETKENHDTVVQDLREAHKEQLVERYAAGKQRMRKKHSDLQDAVRALELARAMIVDMVSWQGTEARRDEVIAELDKAISYFTP
jgi:hypothetical protein